MVFSRQKHKPSQSQYVGEILSGKLRKLLAWEVPVRGFSHGTGAAPGVYQSIIAFTLQNDNKRLFCSSCYY